MSSVVCFEVEGRIVCRSDRELEREQLEARIVEVVEAKLGEAVGEVISRLTREYEMEIIVDLKTGVGKARFKRVA